jgi:polar amino acid transport system permease protein
LSWSWLPAYGGLLWEGLRQTLAILVLSAVFGFLLAILVALGRLSRHLVLAGISLVFSSVIRGTPLLVQIYILYYGVGSLLAHYPAIRHSIFWPYLREGFAYIVLALTLSVGAYVGEVVRGGLNGVPRGEIEAARAFGMSPRLVLRRVWLPRALQILLPTLAGESVMLLKATALASTIAVVDLVGAANAVRAQTYRVFEPLLLVAGIYVVLVLLIERCFGRLERLRPEHRN